MALVLLLPLRDLGGCSFVAFAVFPGGGCGGHGFVSLAEVGEPTPSADFRSDGHPSVGGGL